MEHLRNSYIGTRYIPEGKEWPPNQPKYYVNLAVIHYQGNRTQQELTFSAQHTLADLSMDNKFSFSNTTNQQSRFSNKFKVTQEIIDLFMTDLCLSKTERDADFANLTKSVLIEGAPGIGKTVLLKEIAYRWANGTMLKMLELYFSYISEIPDFSQCPQSMN